MWETFENVVFYIDVAEHYFEKNKEIKLCAKDDDLAQCFCYIYNG